MTATVPLKNDATAQHSVILGTRDGDSILLTGNANRDPEQSGGRIFTTADMPELEGMLLDVFDQLGVESAVFERPIYVAAASGEAPSTKPNEQPRPGFWSMAALGGIPVGTTAIGVAMMISALGGGSALSNPYLALLLIVGGVGLGVTSWAAIREAYRS